MTEELSTEDLSSLPAATEAAAPPPERTTLLSSIRWVYLLIPLAFVLGLGAGYALWGQAEATGATSTSNQAALPADQPIRRYDVPEDDDPVLGAADAPITIIEFSDYECPYCRKWHIEVLPRLLEEYPNQIRLVYRDFPLTSIHPNAASAASAANCADEQGAYWAFNENLFGMELGLSTSAYQQYASELGLDTEAFAECLESERHLEEIQADLEYAANLGVRSTPTFFINGIAIVGAQPFELFKEVIDKELAGEIPK